MTTSRIIITERRLPSRRHTNVAFIGFFISLMFLARIGSTNAGWVDPDTPKEFFSAKALTEGDDRQYELVFSDEFEQEGRTFHDGTDPRWTAVNKNDYTNAALHYYSHDNARTTNGVLNITTERKTNLYKAFNEKTKKFYADKKHVQSAMLQGWNKFCMTGGIVEISAKLPGDPSKGGLWPALWLLGNLARATYVGSSDFVWPFSYNKCDPEVQISQEINACQRVNHFGMAPRVGRGAPEIDILEAMQGEPGKLPHTHIQRPYFSSSLQVAPGVKNDRPVLGQKPRKGFWYSDLEFGNKTNPDLNPFFYGVTLVHKPKSYTYQSDAISANMQLNDTHYQNQHKYRIEWEPPEENSTGGYIKWFSDDEFVFGMSGESLKITETEIPSEPMYLLINTAVSSTWGFPKPCPVGCTCKCFECGNTDCSCGLPTGYCENFPAYFEVDYVRVWQAVNESKHTLGCSTKERPTSLFIKGHEKRYMQEGDKRPLAPVRKGGGGCISDEDCSGIENGACSERGYCVCNGNFTGPHCLAHNGFYDFVYEEQQASLTFHNMMLPKGLIIIVSILGGGFLLSMGYSVFIKQKEGAPYQELGVVTTDNSVQPAKRGNEIASYQNSASADYALPPKQKVVTYCVIDGRLVDS